MRPAALLLGAAASAQAWTRDGCVQSDFDAENNTACCRGWRPDCAADCTGGDLCIVAAKQCTNTTQEWNVTCTEAPVTRLLRGALGDPIPGTTDYGTNTTDCVGPFPDHTPGELSIAACPLLITDYSGANTNEVSITFQAPDGSGIDVCDYLTLTQDPYGPWFLSFKSKLAEVLEVDTSLLETPVPAACTATAPGRRARGLAATVTQVFVISTQAGAPATSGAAGDPFTVHKGKQTQFYLPLPADGRRAVPTSLMACGDVEISAHAFGSGIPGDTQQWFRAFDVTQDGQPLVHVEVADSSSIVESAPIGAGALSAAGEARKRAAGLLADAAAAAAVAEAADDVTVAHIVETRVAAAMQVMHLATSRSEWHNGASGAHVPLTTLNVSVLGREVTQTSTHTAKNATSGTEMFVGITQDRAQHIGGGYSETVAVGAGDMGVEFSSATARKYNGTEAVLKTHIDMRFTHLNLTGCRGPLPEIWGVRPMTGATAAMLLPPAV